MGFCNIVYIMISYFLVCLLILTRTYNTSVHIYLYLHQRVINPCGNLHNKLTCWQYNYLVSNLFVRPIAVFVEILNFYFMKTDNIPVYGNIALYWDLSTKKIIHKIHLFFLFSICTIKTSRALAALALFGLLIVKKLTNVLYYIDAWQRMFHVQRISSKSTYRIISWRH